MKRPSFQFYPADWRNNAKLRRCSEAARGAWMDILCILHDSDEYGVLRWPLADVARSAGVSTRLAQELAAKDVLKGSDTGMSGFQYTPFHAGKAGETVTLIEPTQGPCWFCSRFVRDEWVRSRRGAGTQFNQDNQPPKQSPKVQPIPPIGERQGDGPTTSSPSSSAEESSLRSDIGASAGKPKRERKVLSSLPDDCPNQTDRDAAVEYWRDRGREDLCARLGDEVEAFRNHHRGKGDRMADWSAAWRTWRGNALKFNRAPLVSNSQFATAKILKVV